MSEPDTLERARKCKKLMDEGWSLRKACKEADIDDKTFKRQLPKLEDKKEEKPLTIDIKDVNKILFDKPTHVSTPVKRRQMLIRIPIDVYDYIVGESQKSGIIKPTTLAAEKLTRCIRKEIEENKK